MCASRNNETKLLDVVTKLAYIATHQMKNLYDNNEQQISQTCPSLFGPLSSATTDLQAIIFDVDGTLADTEECHRQAFNEAFAEYGIDWHWGREEYTELLAISGGRERIRAYAEAHLLPRKSVTALRELALKIHTRKSTIYRDKLSNGHIGLRPGVLRLLKEAKLAGVHVALATSTSTFNVETLLRQALDRPIEEYFESVVTSDTVVDKKPSPAVYQYALAELGLLPTECIVIEDTASGNSAARGANLKTVITTHQFTRHHDFSGASLVIDKLGSANEPFNVLAGNSHGASYVDIRLLDTLLSGAMEPTEYEWQNDLAIMAK